MVVYILCVRYKKKSLAISGMNLGIAITSSVLNNKYNIYEHSVFL